MPSVTGVAAFAAAETAPSNGREAAIADKVRRRPEAVRESGAESMLHPLKERWKARVKTTNISQMSIKYSYIPVNICLSLKNDEQIDIYNQ
jgi:hypothetical protein